MQNTDHITIQDCELNMYRIYKQRLLIKIVFIILSIFLAVVFIWSFFYWQTNLMLVTAIGGAVNYFAFMKLNLGLFHDYKFWVVRLRELRRGYSLLNHDK